MIKYTGHYEWLEDDISVAENHAYQFNNDDIVRLREARRNLGDTLIYLHAKLPAIEALPIHNKFLAPTKTYQDIQSFKNQLTKGKYLLLLIQTKKLYKMLPSFSTPYAN